jgi:hypothetical protein
MNKLNESELVAYSKQSDPENRNEVYNWLKDNIGSDELTTLHAFKYSFEKGLWSIDVIDAIRFAIQFAMTKQCDPSYKFWHDMIQSENE